MFDLCAALIQSICEHNNCYFNTLLVGAHGCKWSHKLLTGTWFNLDGGGRKLLCLCGSLDQLFSTYCKLSRFQQY